MKGQAIPYSAEELAFIQGNCTMDRRELTAAFNAKFGRDVALKNINGLCKRNGWLTGRTGRFEKGNIPHPNARPKGPNKGSFKKGSKPHNTAKVGAEAVIDGYIKVKVAEPNQWKWKHRMVWEDAYGPIPKGTNIQFLDGNPLNCALDNLEALTREEQAPLNKTGYSKLPAEVKPVARTVAKLNKLIREKVV